MLAATPKEEEPLFRVEDRLCRRFSLDEIRSVTRNFNKVIGRGGFGKVYKGSIKDGSNTVVVAIKILNSMSNQGALEFQAEVEMLSKIRHCNLVSLIGYSYEGKEMALVYEYMPQGTLDDHLHKDGSPLSWLQLLKICKGAARGLDYLHTGTGTQHGIIHRDVKSSNILLDSNFAAKISDFGIAKIGPTNQTCTHVSTLVKGTFGYMDPRYFHTGKLTIKSDVYSFGVLLLEVICGRPAVDTSLDEEQWGLAPWAEDRIKEGKLNHIVDSRLKEQISSNCLKDFRFFRAKVESKSNKLNPFSLNVLKMATRNFRPDTLVGEGGFGSVFKGWFDEQSLQATKPGRGVIFAVKRLNEERHQDDKEWLADIYHLSMLNHPNLVKLIGYCLEDDRRLLVFEFIHRGSLENHLFGSCSSPREEIYNFGVVLLEVLSGKRNIDNNRPANERIQVDFIRPHLDRKQGIKRIIDTRIDGQYTTSVARRFAMIMKRCLSIQPTDRPTADEVVKALEELQDTQESSPTPRVRKVSDPRRATSATTSTGANVQKS
ncbi:hypothetical protein OSB04_014918 [Centaurea solstitialis]|uniref:non-specific serine/threonine protein kinase n=1 Tax=Centaurea solstitialis TaxID=347529 RepID=A0AA38SY62_9ASTR|nr:hypothetical protein OSB04_014918 [Centaurea solstitialis]